MENPRAGKENSGNEIAPTDDQTAEERKRDTRGTSCWQKPEFLRREGEESIILFLKRQREIRSI